MGDLEELRQQLAEALAGLEAERDAKREAQSQAEAERDAKREAQSQAEAENDAKREAQSQAEAAQRRAEAAEHQAEVERHAAQKAERKSEADREKYAKEKFFGVMAGMATRASQNRASRGSSDHGRAHVPETRTDSTLVNRFATVSRSELRKCWNTFKAFFKTWEPPQNPRGSFERRNVHPVMNKLVLAAMPADSPLRVWVEEVVADSLAMDEMEPDMTLTSSRDEIPTSLGAVAYGEWKRPKGAGCLSNSTNLQAAAQQSRSCARRSVARLCQEADDRGDDVGAISMVVFGSCGQQIVFSWVYSGAPSAGGSYCDAVPFPSEQSPPLPLLDGWDFINPNWQLPDNPPDGFKALACMLSTPLDQLGRRALPLERLTVHWKLSNGHDELQLNHRLGAGGYSDVYEIVGNVSLSSGQVRSNSCVVKLPRAATASVSKMYAMESKCLSRLAMASTSEEQDSDDEQRPVWPQLLAVGERLVHSTPLGGAPPQRSSWPVLLLAPAGVSLSTRLQEVCRSARRNRQGSVILARRELADAVLRDVLLALRRAHSRGLVHLDVRPDNIVWAQDRWFLMDWGLSREFGMNLRHIGTEAFAPDNMFAESGPSTKATPSVDLIAAVYTWLALAYGIGDSAKPPWLRVRREVFSVAEARRLWLSEISENHRDAAFMATVVLPRLTSGVEVGVSTSMSTGSTYAFVDSIPRAVLTPPRDALT